MTESNRQPTYKRQRFLLSFVRQVSGTVTATDLQKLVFLHTIEQDSGHYMFIPYKFGSYSFQLAEDLDILRRDGYIVFDDSRIKATKNSSDMDQYSIAAERGDNLIKKVYREYPYYAMNSEILGRLFTPAEILQFQQVREEFSREAQTLFTIGYEGKSIEEFVNILIKNDVKLLCDVRKNPLSRKFGFSKNKLKHIVETVDIKYIHFPALGIDSCKRSVLETKADYQRLFADYAKELPQKKQHLVTLYQTLETNERIALMCYERDPDMCHRHVIRDYLTNTHSIECEDL